MMIWRRKILSAGSVDRRLATCAADASNPCISSGASSEISCASNPASKEDKYVIYESGNPPRTV